MVTVPLATVTLSDIMPFWLDTAASDIFKNACPPASSRLSYEE
jgi:hypothetical protein